MILRRRSRPATPQQSREERKEQTRRRLIAAALDLMGDDRSFPALSLRHVARRAGITPNAFYRHFESMDDLGLAILDDVGPTLRRLLREVRKEGGSASGIVRRSVSAYLRFVRDHEKYFIFIVRERGGGSARLRSGIRRDVGYFASELAADIGEMAPAELLPSSRAMRLMADLVIETMLGVATEIIDLPPNDPEAERELTERFVDQVVVIVLGATAWDHGTRQRNEEKALKSGIGVRETG